MKWLPNVLSAFRLIVGFPILYLTIKGEWLAALILIICGYLSDLFDGFLARRYNTETPTGKIIDITADIILDESIICGLVLTHQISWWLVIFIVPVIIIIRLPHFSSQTFYFKFGSLMLPAYCCCMVWLIVTTYAKKALGDQGLFYGLALAVPIALIIVWLKRERIKRDFERVKVAFFRRG